MTRLSVLVQHADFDVAALQHRLLAKDHGVGAVAGFTGHVRADEQARPGWRMFLEHYPGMTERSIESILATAAGRYDLHAASVVHRVGWLQAGDQIVWVGVASAHRGQAFSACEFVMDYLKTRAPLWKKEGVPPQMRWVQARASDSDRAARWTLSENSHSE